ncbi:hypothetical protein OPT61_g6101 [Boeremia exigua]|uniref:Uncharacterized protein n=1 Tax=Boeremia exigua TaxID=749465 RepID=A0ACC2I7V7_9PLEO|nr:hypothetical protein OPT61_g6101 [Boeremia exigua]
MHRGTQITLGDTGRPEDRVVRIVNLCYNAESDIIRNFFRGFTVVDYARGVNVKSQKHTIGYVLFATEQERIRAQVLSGRKILDREVQVVNAQGGFRISASGDKLLPEYEEQDTTALDAEGFSDLAAPAVSDFEAFPSLCATAKPLLGRASIFAPLLRQRIRKQSLQNRILFLNNVGQGPEVDLASFRLFFSNYTVVDVKRPIDPTTQTPHPTAFVMLASKQERDDALQDLKGVPMQGRDVTLEVPKTVQRVDEFGFVTPSKTTAVASLSQQDDTVATTTPRSTSESDTSSHEELRGTASNQPKLLHQPGSVEDNIKVHTQMGELGLEDSKTQQASIEMLIQPEQDSEAARQVEDIVRTNSTELIWGMSKQSLSERYKLQQRTLLPIPPGAEGSSKIVVGPRMTPPVGSISPFAVRREHAPRRPRQGIDTSFRPREYAWSLGSDRNPAHQVISEEAWYAALPSRP